MSFYILIILSLLHCQFIFANDNVNTFNYFPSDISQFPLIFIDTIENMEIEANHQAEFWPIPLIDRNKITTFNQNQFSKRKVVNLLVQPNNLKYYNVLEYRYLVKPVHQNNATTIGTKKTNMYFQVYDRLTYQFYPIYQSGDLDPTYTFLNDLDDFMNRKANMNSKTKSTKKVVSKEEKKSNAGQIALFGLGIAMGPIIAVLIDL